MTKILDKQSMLLLAVHALFIFATALSGTFLPIYLWKNGGSYALIGLFTLAQYLCSGVTFWMAGNWVKEKNKMIVLRVGMALCGIFYCIVLWLQDDAIRNIYLLGLLLGAANGLFWISFNVVYFEITSPENRDRYNGWAGIFTAASGMLAPWISGFVISAMAGESGYTVIFLLSLLLFITGAVLSFWLQKRPPSGTYNWKHCYMQLCERGNPWRRMFAAVAAQGVREGVFMFLIGLIIFAVTKEESKVGNYSLITSAVAFVSFWAVGRWLQKRHRSAAMMIGSVMAALAILPLFTGISYSKIVWFGICASLFMPLYTIPMTSQVFDLIGANEKSVCEREEFVVLRELALTLGRVFGIVIYIIIVYTSSEPDVLAWMLFIIGSVPIASWLLLRPILRNHSRT